MEDEKDIDERDGDDSLEESHIARPVMSEFTPSDALTLYRRGDSLVLFPTWRSQIIRLFFYFVAGIVCIYLSHYLSFTIVDGPLFPVGAGMELRLKLPLAIFLPAYLLGIILFTIYNSRYIIDARGVEAQVGLVALSLRQPKLRYEDIRGVEPLQTLWERILGIGSLNVGSAMTFEIEIQMKGIASPRSVQLIINRERDKHLRWLRKTGRESAAVRGD
ncbi:MAG: PH domain-containing protein [bacterium]|nr:PH domain-containing protein [bacterium]